MNTTPCHTWLNDGGEDLWHPDNRLTSAATQLAKKICRTCPVRAECLTEALAFEAANTHGMRHGVWGGLDAGERALMAKATA